MEKLTKLPLFLNYWLISKISIYITPTPHYLWLGMLTFKFCYYIVLFEVRNIQEKLYNSRKSVSS